MVRHNILRVVILIVLLGVQSFELYADEQYDYARLERKARNYAADEEWASANAMYLLMTDIRPKLADNYGGAIVTATLAGDTITAMNMVERSQTNLVPIDSLFASIETHAFTLGRSSLYEILLYRIKARFPWLERVADRELLNYYIFRNNGKEITRYALSMLEGLPDSIRFLRLLAKGYMLSGQSREAIDVWQRILAIDPDNYDTLIDLGNYYAGERQYDLARPYLENAYRLMPTPYVASMLNR